MDLEKMENKKMEENGNKIEKVNGIGKGSKIGMEEAKRKEERRKPCAN